MTKRHFYSFSVICFIFIAGLFFSSKVMAQQSITDTVGVTISPVLFEAGIEPGESIEHSVYITNTNNKEVTYHLTASDTKIIDESGRVGFYSSDDASSAWSIRAWLSFQSETITIPPHEKVEVRVNISAPMDASPGGHHGAIMVASQPEKEGLVEQTGSGVGYQVASLILLRVAGDISEEADIFEFSTDKKIYTKPEVGFSTRINNSGNVHIKPIGFIKIFNTFDTEKAKLIVNETGANILPQSTRQLTNDWQSDFAFGRYRAELGLSFGEEVKQSGTAELTFWVIPDFVIIIVSAAILALIIFGLISAKIFKRRILRSAGRTEQEETPKDKPSLPIGLSIFIAILVIVIGLILYALFI